MVSVLTDKLSTEEQHYVTANVPEGHMAILNCTSTDKTHNFLFWDLANDSVIGPGNKFNETKYNYEVLSGRLFIKAVSGDEAGIYKCVSKSINGDELKVGAIKMVVKNVTHPHGTPLEAFEVICIVISILVMIGCAIAFYRLRQGWNKYDGRTVLRAEDDDEDGDEIYNRTTTALQHPIPGPSRNASSDHLVGFDNHGIDTDFNSVFEQIQIKMPDKKSLI